MPGACTHSVESLCVAYDSCRLGGVMSWLAPGYAMTPRAIPWGILCRPFRAGGRPVPPQRHSMPGAWTHSVESLCVAYDSCRLGGVMPWLALKGRDEIALKGRNEIALKGRDEDSVSIMKV